MAKVDFKVVKVDRKCWYAYHSFYELRRFAPHRREIAVPTHYGAWRSVDAVEGRTPFEALERLKKALRSEGHNV